MTIENILDKVLKHRDIYHDNKLYLKRYYLLPRSWPVKLFLHAIYKPDDDREPHDHPFRFIGLILKGAYSEALYNQDGTFNKYHVRTTGSIAYRSLKDIHQIESVLSDKVWTLLITGQAKQVWGFFKDGEKIPWYEYQDKPNLPPIEDDPGCVKTST